jgi:GNAT superfamily N-acetyltransferase
MEGAIQFLDLELAETLISKTTPAKYVIGRDLIKSHMMDSPLLDLEASRWATFNRELRAFICVKASASSLFSGPDPLQAHLSLCVFDDPQYVQPLLDRAVEVLRNRGIQKLIFGQDSLHIFPGCPVDHVALMGFLEQNGFESQSDQVDLERDMGSYVVPEGVLIPLIEPYEARPCGPDDLSALLAFFEAEFAGRWKFDITNKWNLEGPETVIGLFEGAICHGFALLQQDGCVLPIGGAVWKQALGPGWGSLGPIGISKSVRGKGLGDALLGKSLEILRDRGAKRSIIDWTTLIDFYGKHGFSPDRKYKALVKQLV